MRRRRAIAVASALWLAGCASAGGTRNVFSLASAWYKHPSTGEVLECGGGAYPGVQIRRYNCGKRLIDAGYAEVEKCEENGGRQPCVTREERDEAERREEGRPREESRVWILWRGVEGDATRGEKEQWSVIRAFGSRGACETELSRAGRSICLPDTIDPRGPKAK